ncbi:MAG: hypothetical protein US71_C0011G0030 [Parcubacteria group bacterium GW2011_GWD2_38_12]|nr:MAG: hypothetical protein US71_C0011G0030 [Parcubacteria group bacterium GW2011_GWD2_38_12]KKQ59295.1 MAG: hypothetical protein US78_C0006G0002 [Parcubacteria group bacterium GW2011_GWD1_38_16]
MIKLNLLPPIEKNNYKTEIMRRFVIFFGIGIFIITTIFIGLLAFNYLFLYLQLSPEMKSLEAEKTTEKYKKVEELENQIKDTNKKIGLILTIKNQVVPTFPIIEKISKAANEKDSYLKSFVIDRENSTASIKGFALERDHVVKIQDNLRNDQQFSDINAPYSNFLKQRNVDFLFDFKIQ